MVVILGGFLIDVQVAWKSASAPARLPNNFDGLHDIYIIQQEPYSDRNFKIYPIFPLQNTASLIISLWAGLLED